MEILFSDSAEKDFLSFERKLQDFFRQHLLKLARMPPRRHMKHGLPWHVERVTQSARLVYDEKNGVLRVLRCFATHRDYEKWYGSFRA
jgi:hypothetical protein